MGYKNNLKLTIIAAVALFNLGLNNSYGSFPAQQKARRSSYYETIYFKINTTTSPFDNVAVRYALAMATDRRAIADAMREESFRYFPGVGLVPPYDGYETLSHLAAVRDGKTYDLLAYNPASARDLLAKAGFPGGIAKNGQRVNIEILVYTGEDTDKLVTIVKQQWEQNLGLEATVVSRKWHDYLREKDERNFKGVALAGKSLLLANASNLLSFATGQVAKKPSWVDQTFDLMLREAAQAASSNAFKGNSKFRECEEYLLRSMPVIPLYSRSLE
ncbi:MAG TPA: ABC transporter substrate-binding protein [Blastocatellia bacterium]|nr:ABC transporter substrate-binding protein [Blastocatellia bacterium]